MGYIHGTAAEAAGSGMVDDEILASISVDGLAA